MVNSTRGSGRIVETENLAAAARAIDEFLRALGQLPTDNPELVGTGARVAEAFASEFCAGYGVDLRQLLREHVLNVDPKAAGSDAAKSRVILRNLPLVTMCPHHLLPAEGTADVAFEPDGRLVGLGGVAALVETAGKRLVLQEVLGEEIAQVIDDVLLPRWVRLRLRLAHSCVRVRGERAHGSIVETFVSRGEGPDASLVLMGEAK